MPLVGLAILGFGAFYVISAAVSSEIDWRRANR